MKKELTKVHNWTGPIGRNQDLVWVEGFIHKTRARFFECVGVTARSYYLYYVFEHFTPLLKGWRSYWVVNVYQGQACNGRYRSYQEAMAVVSRWHFDHLAAAEHDPDYEKVRSNNWKHLDIRGDYADGRHDKGFKK